MEDQRQATKCFLDNGHLCDLEGKLQHVKGMACVQDPVGVLTLMLVVVVLMKKLLWGGGCSS